MMQRARRTLWTKLLIVLQDCKFGIDATASPKTGNNVALSPSKRKRKNLHKYGSTEHSIASSAKELTSILTESLAIQKEQAY